MRKTKIVCTIGPACDSETIIEQMIAAGMNVARLNFSHGTKEYHGDKIRLIRQISARMGVPVAILQDLAGPKIRVGKIPEPGITLEPGRKFILTSRKVYGLIDTVSLSYPDLPREVKKGDRLLLADGLMELIVEDMTETDIFCRVITGGLLSSHKGINLPTGTIKAPPLTEKDKIDLLFGLANQVDYVALSFVKSGEDIHTIKKLIAQQGKDTPVIAKIEKHEALENLDDIIRNADAIMVARGDLGVEIPPEEVPLIQKKMIRSANLLGKPVITATQMLRSMVNQPRPTRAEAADVANAVLDGTDAVMLSEETASGNYPVEAVGFMNRIASAAEAGFPFETYLQSLPEKEMSASVAHASCILANHLDARVIIAHTQSGLTARQIARFRPKQPILALSPNETTVRQLSLLWGCLPKLTSESTETDDMIEKSAQTAIEAGVVEKGDLVVITVGHPLWVAGTTNMIRVKKIGERALP
ncbi:MAG: pyruvate kinase [Smithellaceae bacterium]|nr:pyruvate kinase [Smithellaceae bacterium]